MSCDLNLRGVKRKLYDRSVVVANDGTKLEVDPCDDLLQRRIRLDDSGVDDVDYISPSTTIAAAVAAAVVATTSPPPLDMITEGGGVSSTNDNYKPLMASSPASLSSESLSDDEGSDDDDDDYPSDEYAKDQLYLSQTSEDLFGVGCGGGNGAESESGYDERASNSSDSTSSDSEFGLIDSITSSPSPTTSSPPITSTASSIYSPPSQLDLATFSPSVPSTSSAGSAPVRNSTPNGYTNGGFYCPYSMSPSSTSQGPKAGITYQQQQQHYQSSQSYLQRNNPNNTPTTAAASRHNSNQLRQKLFHMSMIKLSKFRQASDPSLHRSVLICNTLHMLEKELERDGMKVNVGPNGVSFISPLATRDLDFLPMLQTPSSTECMPGDVPFTTTSSSSTEQSYHQYSCADSSVEAASAAAPAGSGATSSPDYDKYFAQVDSSSSSGRATPFVKQPAFPSTSSGSNSNSGEYSNSAFWGSEPMSDRLTSLNWSSMLSFSSSSTTTASSSTAEQEAIVDSTRQSEGTILSFPTEPQQSTESPVASSSSTTSSTPATFATLLPPASTLTSSSLDPMLVSSTAPCSPFLSSTTTTAPYSSHSTYQCSSQTSSSPSGTTSSTTSTTNSYSYYTNDEIFADIDLTLYDFDFSPLSPPNLTTTNKSSSIMSAEELIRNIASSPECGATSGATASNGATVTATAGLSNQSAALTASTTAAPASSSSSNTSTLLSINHSVNGYSGHNYTSSSSYFGASSTSLSSSFGSNGSAMTPSANTGSSSQLGVNCGSTSANGLHLHAASGRYYKTPEERDQQAITTIKCHN